MNPLILRFGFVAVVGAAVVIYHFFKNRNGEQTQSYLRNSSEDTVWSKTRTCCICMEDFKAFSDKNEISFLPCKHKFHKICIKILFDHSGSQKTCPVCRKEVPQSFMVHEYKF